MTENTFTLHVLLAETAYGYDKEKHVVHVHHSV